MLNEAYFQLPSIQSFTQRINDALIIHQKSVVLITPLFLSETVIASRFYRSWGGQSSQWKRVLAKPSVNPIEVVFDLDHFTSGTPSLENLIKEETHDVIHIVGLDQLPDSDFREWMRFYERWSDAAQSRSSSRLQTAALFTIISSGDAVQQLPQSNVFLAIESWLGVLSLLEVQLLCRLRTGGSGEAPLAFWRESVLPDLVGDDLNLLDWLWERIETEIHSTEALIDCLKAYGQMKMWTPESLPNWNSFQTVRKSALSLNHITLKNSDPLYKSWLEGTIHALPEHGWEPHVAALALANQTEEITQRYWRGQAKLLLPFLDQLRLLICSHFTERYGETWASRWITPEYNPQVPCPAQSPFDVEWGQLNYLISQTDLIPREKRWIQLVRSSHTIRNEIAHYHPVQLIDFRRLWYEREQFATKA